MSRRRQAVPPVWSNSTKRRPQRSSVRKSQPVPKYAPWARSRSSARADEREHERRRRARPGGGKSSASPPSSSPVRALVRRQHRSDARSAGSRTSPGSPRSSYGQMVERSRLPTMSIVGSARWQSRGTHARLHQQKLEWLEQLREEALHAGSEKSVERQRSEGEAPRARARGASCSTRARSSSSTATSATARSSSGCASGDRTATRSSPATGRSSAASVFVFSQDFTVFGGSLQRGLRREDLQGDGPGREATAAR